MAIALRFHGGEASDYGVLDMSQCILLGGYQYFGGTCCLCLNLV
jgi:hypothetical protein